MFLTFRVFAIGVVWALASGVSGYAQSSDNKTSDSQSSNEGSKLPIDLRLFGDTLLRYEYVEQDNFPDRSNGLTQGFRLGVEAKLHPKLFALIEGEAVYGFVDDFNDGTDLAPTRPTITDPDGVELNRLQLQANLTPQTFLTVGRQQIALDDQRFIGTAPLRQNTQSFDAVHFSARLKNSTTLQTGYIRRVNRPLGGDNPVGRFGGNSFFFNANIATPLGRVGAFHYALDLETGEEAQPINTLSSQTSGVRLDGRWHADTFGLDWEASYARQTDFADNPLDYTAQYWLAGFEAFAGPLRFGVRSETLGAGDEQAFQTPLGTLLKFQGLADVFLITPPDGVANQTVSSSLKLGRIGAFSGVTFSAEQHWFHAERGNADYGREIDLSASATFKTVQLSLIYANYKADTFASDTQRVFLSVSRRF